MIQGFLVAFALFLATTGWGAVGLRGLGLHTKLKRTEIWPAAFALGFGLTGFMMFWPGLLGAFRGPVIGILVLAGLVGLRLLPRPGLGMPARPREAPLGVLMAALLAVHTLCGLIQAALPPVDADTLAYHYDLPKRFLEAGHIFFVPRAVDGAVPLLIQLTYAPVMALGGDPGLGIWALMTTGAAGWLLWSLVRRFASASWATAGTLVFIGTPAVLHAGGTGQVEVRLALFALLAAFALCRWREEGGMAWPVLAGLAAGFFMGGKYTGLLFATACGLALLLHGRRGIGASVAFGLAALVAGSQWYVWNWIHSGDPVFPMLFGLLGEERVKYWTPDAERTFRSLFIDTESPLSNNLANLFAYPLLATFRPLPGFEAGRTGLGLTPILLVPTAAWGLWIARSRLTRSRWLPLLTISLFYYLLWFFLGGSQRVRHLVPLLPLLLAGVLAASLFWASNQARRRLVAAGLASILLVQLGGALVAARWYAVRLGEDPAAISREAVGFVPLAEWANANLGPQERLLNPYREINYLLEIPFYHAHSVDQALVDLQPERLEARRFWRQLRKQAITHLVATPSLDANIATDRGRDMKMWSLLRQWRDEGCVTVVGAVLLRQVGSRLLEARSEASGADILRLQPADCRWEGP